MWNLKFTSAIENSALIVSSLPSFWIVGELIIDYEAWR